jgi:putative copper export protein/mono/diheme cytochrome c family protein
VPVLPLAAGGSLDAFLRRLRFVLVGALALLLVGGAVELLLQARDIDAGIGTTLDTRWGGRWALRNLALVLSAMGLLGLMPASRMTRAAAWTGLAGGVAYLGVTATVSHAAAGAGAFWAVASDFAHLLTVSVWLGMLAALLLLFLWARSSLARGDRYPVLAPALQRFSVAAFLSLALLLFSGVISAVIEVARLSDLLDTGYGRTLLLKLALILPLLGLAGTNAFVLRPDYVETGESTAGWARTRLEELEQALFRTMRFELLAALAVLAVAALLVQLAPTRGQAATAAQAPGPFTGTAEAEGIAVTFVSDPNQPGINTFSVYLSGAVNTVESVRLNFFPPRDAGELSRLVMDASNPPTFYVGRGPFITAPGRWRIEVDLRRSAGSDLAIPFSLNVAGAGGVAATSSRGGDFAAPVDWTAPRLALIAGAGLLLVGLVIGSVSRPGLPAGYLGRIAENVLERVGPIRPRPAVSLLALVAIGVGLGLVLGSHLHNPVSPEEAAEGNPVPQSPESVARGREIFISSCTQCHGESGRGDGPLARTLPIPPANLYDHVPYHPDQFFFQVITNGLSGVMPAFGTQLSEEDRWHVLNYLRDQFGQPVPQE